MLRVKKGEESRIIPKFLVWMTREPRLNNKSCFVWYFEFEETLGCQYSFSFLPLRVTIKSFSFKAHPPSPFIKPCLLFYQYNQTSSLPPWTCIALCFHLRHLSYSSTVFLSLGIIDILDQKNLCGTRWSCALQEA